MACLSDDRILELAQGRLGEDAVAEAERHLNECARCRRLASEALRYFHGETAEEAASRRILVAGTQVGRFEILGVLGVGAAGIVYRARDGQLKRQVALKLLRPDITEPHQVAGWRNRMLLEAEAMARLSHPNVVVVYEVGTYEETVFIAMEIVEGESLADWLEAKAPSWREIVEVFIPIGKGLAATHDAGVVHGDFKPVNVMIAADGRPRIADFGLAESAPTGGLADLTDSQTALRSSSKRPKVSGTPLYMAPEQLLGRGAEARSDQFSFCVALFRALYGRHPFSASASGAQSTRGITLAISRGELKEPPPDHPVPADVYRALERGLAKQPEDRHPSMGALATALEQALDASGARARRKVVRMVAGAVGLGGLLAAGLWGSLWLAALPRCGDGDRAATEQCDDGNRDPGDACLPTCRLAVCGDGQVRAGVEECDDGNKHEGDGCSASCLACGLSAREVFLPESGRCYARHDQPATWEAARRACGASGGDLATFGDGRDEADAVRTALLGPDATGLFWIGLTTTTDRAGIRWLDDSAALRLMPFSNAAVETPRDACVALSLGTSHLEPSEGSRPPAMGPAGQSPSGPDASDLEPAHSGSTRSIFMSCEQPARFLCERAPWRVRSEDAHAYKLVLEAVDWRTAADRCASLAAHLVTVESKPEHDLVASLGRVAVWIGATDSKNEGSFEWITGAAVVERFAPGEPNDLGGDNDCVALERGAWWDRRCDLKHAFVCERE